MVIMNAQQYVFNPMVPLNPETNEAIYCTMKFVADQAKKCGYVVVHLHLTNHCT